MDKSFLEDKFLSLTKEFVSIVTKPALEKKTLEIQGEIIKFNMQLESNERMKAIEFLTSAMKNPSLTFDQYDQIISLFKSIMSPTTNKIPKLSCNDEFNYKQLYLNDRF